eukprot:3670419-Pyramimonas_sp.AAC.1
MSGFGNPEPPNMFISWGYTCYFRRLPPAFLFGRYSHSQENFAGATQNNRNKPRRDRKRLKVP